MTAMLIHGLDRESTDWDPRVIGISPNLLGRATRGIELLLKNYPEAEIVYFGSGKTTKSGRGEGAETMDEVFDRWDEICSFEAFEHLWPYGRWRLKNRLYRIARPINDPKADNTYGEVAYAIPRCFAAGVRRLVLVSDPPHVSRCDAHGIDLLKRQNLIGKMHIVVEHSDVCHPEQNPSDVVVFEPTPGDPDPIGVIHKRSFKIKPEQMPTFKERQKALYAEFDA